MEDSLKNALYYHLRTKLHNFLESSNIRIYPEFHYKDCKADLAIVKMNDDYGSTGHLKDDIETVLAIIEIKYKSDGNVKHFEDDVLKIKKYIDSNPKETTQYYLAFIHEIEFEFNEEDSWLTLKKQKWAKGRVTELSGYFVEGQNEMRWQVLSHI
jgi:hypothetical protein